jgi:hypothetical protein
MTHAARRALPRCALLLATLLACGGEEFVRPNLVLISVDALRPGQLSCYGGPRELGAQVCELGETGVRYVWAFTTASSGGPAAASLLTSQYPRQHGVRDGASDFLRSSAGTLAEALRAGGYATGAFIGSPELNRSRNFRQGFDVFDDRAASPTSGAPETALADAALGWVEQASRPYFLWIHFAEPHGPFVSADHSPPGAAADLWIARYEAAIRRLDRRLSQLIAVLDASGSVPGILLVGLHGQALGALGADPGHGTSVRLEEIRVPLLWRPPRAAPGQNVARRVTTPVSLIDVAPTLLDAAGLRWPPTFQGLGLLVKPGAASDVSARALFAEHPNEVAVVTSGEYARARRLAPRTMPPLDDATSTATARPPDEHDDHPQRGGTLSPAAPDETAVDAAPLTEPPAPAPSVAVALPDLTADLRPHREPGDEGLPAYDRSGSAPERAERLGRVIADFVGAASQAVE